MKTNTMVIEFQNLNNFFTNTKFLLDKAIKSSKPSLQKKGHLLWSSPETYQSFMNDQKYAILAAIKRYHPTSVYQLAKILGRAQQNVARDCALLAGHGFISFHENKTGRKSKAPTLAFTYDAIEVRLPAVTYKIDLNPAA